MKRCWTIIGIVGLILLLTGCAGGLVCRHNVMADAAWAEEKGFEYKIVVYQVPGYLSFGIYDAHAQVHTAQGWIATVFGYPILSENRTYPLTGWEGRYDAEMYMSLMRRNCFNALVDCRDEGIPFRGMLP